jgi:hypothetical protein
MIFEIAGRAGRDVVGADRNNVIWQAFRAGLSRGLAWRPIAPDARSRLMPDRA